ncbi:CRISPR-associated DxTHG motif protein [Enterococcus hulanensis]|nr:CRISPR-associated DxTHG motif protein [Enterococcus hulanensis]MBX8937837.1 CRISPR-associated DxTHG motif protein [Enterococcus gilvus]
MNQHSFRYIPLIISESLC